MKCWKCGEAIDLPQSGRLPFRASCDRCHRDLHCCKNCKNYKPGLPNNCAIPGTEYIADREACNFCEDFELLGVGPQATANPSDVAKKLFGDDDGIAPKKFDDLFHD